MKLWLDDLRLPPEGWEWCRTADEAIALLATGTIVEISLDHDLGRDEKTGYDVACWIERAVAEGFIRVPRWKVHSSDPAGSERMADALRSADYIQSRFGPAKPR